MNTADKHMTWDDALSWRHQVNGPLVFTNGCFDLLHPGHVAYLEAARSLGVALVVGLNSDASVQRLKGPSRPVQAEQNRARVLAGLAAVDGVVIFDQDTPIALIEYLTPDVHVKGGDYQVETLPETPVVQAYGGRVVVVPFVVGHGCTGIIDRIRGQHG